MVVLLLAGAGAASAAARPVSLVAVRGRDLGGLSRLLAAQQDPESPTYRRWLTPAEFGRRFGADAHALRAVRTWMRAAGCRVRPFPGRQHLACLGGAPAAVPAALQAVVTTVLDPASAPPLRFHLGVPTRLARAARTPTEAFGFTPRGYGRYYGWDGVRAGGIDGAGQRIGILAVSRVRTDDVDGFRSTFGLPPASLEQAGFDVTAGLQTLQYLEALLDTSWAGAIAPGAGVLVQVAGGALIDGLAELVNRDDVAIISTSVSLVPSASSRRYIREARRLFRQAAAQGQTVLSASGDTGPLVPVPPRLRRGADPFASSPFVTAVGGTTPAVDSAVGAFPYAGERVWQDGLFATSGGGPSALPRPRYQHGSAHRTVPDVSLAASAVYPLVLGGSLVCCVSGTSAAAPAWAGVVALLDQRLGRRVGFLNPELYRLGRAQQQGDATAFHDIVEGSNDVPRARGYPAKPGYDLATGWGTPNGSAFFEAFR